MNKFVVDAHVRNVLYKLILIYVLIWIYLKLHFRIFELGICDTQTDGSIHKA